MSTISAPFKPGTDVRSAATTMASEACTRNRKKIQQPQQAVDTGRLRPPSASGERIAISSFSDEVDAITTDGWWEGVITGVLPGNRYSVFFRATREQLEFSGSELRVHREWFYGNWVPPLEQEAEASISIELNVCDSNKFIKGATVEVCSDEDGFYGAWFTATVLEQLSNGSFKIEMLTPPHPPCPPKETANHFRLFEEVDACTMTVVGGCGFYVLSADKNMRCFLGDKANGCLNSLI
ncbi:hypothetical protein R6Q59_010932 [Mikania micrantha]